MKVEQLLPNLLNMDHAQLLEHIRRIREDRRISKKPDKPITRKAKSDDQKTKLRALFALLTPAEKAELAKSLLKESS